jgi:hypothetical protein
MLKNTISLYFMIAEKAYHFICDNDSPLEHVKEALFQCQKYIGQIEDQVKAAQAAQEQPKENEEAPKVDAEEAKVESLEQPQEGV